MFDGDYSWDNVLIIECIFLHVEFLTIVLSSVQSSKNRIFFLDIIQTFLCWPTNTQGICISILLWCFRSIERILGHTGLLIYLLYSLITFIPVFCFAIYLEGFEHHFPFLIFVPLSLFVYTMIRIPDGYHSVFSDKFGIIMVFFLVLIQNIIPNTLSLFAALLGYFIWKKDCFRLRKLICRS